MAQGALYKFAFRKLVNEEIGRTGIIEKRFSQPILVNAEMIRAEVLLCRSNATGRSRNRLQKGTPDEHERGTDIR